jgi:hypothetical protein
MQAMGDRRVRAVNVACVTQVGGEFDPRDLPRIPSHRLIHALAMARGIRKTIGFEANEVLRFVDALVRIA